MAAATASSLFVSSLANRLTEPRILVVQAALVFLPLVAVRGTGVVAPGHPVLALAVIPACVVLTLFFAVDVIQRTTLRIEEQPHADTDIEADWQSIADRTLVVFNTALVVPILVWGQPIVGTLGYTTEALTAVLPVARVAGNHTVASSILVGGVVVGSAVTTRGVLAWAQAQFGPDLSTERLEAYLALRAALPAAGPDSLVPRSDGGRDRLPTVTLAETCVEYSLTRIVPDGVPEWVDVERVTATLPSMSVSTAAKMVFLTTLNGRFLVTLFGSLGFVYGGAFGLSLPTIHTYTLWLGTGLGVVSQAVYNHPFVSPSRDVLRR